ncbi:hypothetical protein N499_1131 [Wolbachia pipientis wVitA]|nr:hypothetical protein gwv_1131 [Wolbachia phage WO]ONI57213.1 hypothetical protein N499_1131 [Wolbachia pipientis wVitA]
MLGWKNVEDCDKQKLNISLQICFYPQKIMNRFLKTFLYNE